MPWLEGGSCRSPKTACLTDSLSNFPFQRSERAILGFRSPRASAMGGLVAPAAQKGDDGSHRDRKPGNVDLIKIDISESTCFGRARFGL